MAESNGGSILVSIVVPCRNEIDFILDFLEDLQEQEGIQGPAEFLIADGASTDGTRQLLEDCTHQIKELRIIDNSAGFVSTGLNRAISEARGEFILRMDVHTRYAPDYICSCLEVLKETGADNVGGAARVRPGRGWGEAIAAAYASPFAVGGASFHFPDHEGWVDTVPYGCWRKKTLEDLGGFDEELVRNQDDELNLRLVRTGGRIWQSARIRSWYVPRSDIGSLFRQYFQYGYWKIAVIRKHRIPASFRHLVPGLFVGSLLTLGILSPWASLGRILLTLQLICYGLFLVVGTLRISRSRGWHLVWRLPLVLGTYHLAYGLGTLAGLMEYRRHGSATWATGLTRQRSQDGGEESGRLRNAYLKRKDQGRYALDQPAQRKSLSEVEEGILQELALNDRLDLAGKRVLDVGCGGGYWLGRMLEWGAEPAMLAGIDAIESRIEKAAQDLPSGCGLQLGDAASLPFRDIAFDLVSQFVVFSSILDPQIRARVAAEMDRVLRPGGCLLWYDFFRDNPRNRDVTGVRRAEIEALFPGYRLTFHRVTLAPPLARRLARLSSRLMNWAWRLKILRTHFLVVGWKRSE